MPPPSGGGFVLDEIKGAGTIASMDELTLNISEFLAELASKTSGDAAWALNNAAERVAAGEHLELSRGSAGVVVA